tara:strand:- start:1026 stop:1280 length:255 start_codon:yes stop_codon:yes gene_type:complete
MALEPEDLIANAKSDLSQAIILLLKRRNYYFDRQRVSKYRETNCQISQIRTAIKNLDQNSAEKVLPPIPKRLPHPSKWGNQVFS